MKTFLAGVLPNSLYLVCMPQKLKWTQRVWAANSQPPLSCAARGRRHTECWAGRPATKYTCACTRQFWRVSFFKALMAWPQHLLHFLKTDRLWSSTCSSHTAALSRNDRTHTQRLASCQGGGSSRLRPELSQRCQGGSCYELTQRPPWNGANYTAVQGLPAIHRCFTKPKKSSRRQIWAGGQVLLSWKLGSWF